MSDLVAFLRARLDEDEAIANRAARKRRGPWRIIGNDLRAIVHGSRGPDLSVADTPGSMIADHIARHDPARVLREVEAKRAILQWCTPDASTEAALERGDISTEEWVTEEIIGSHVLRILAAVYADHPGYDAAWKP